MPPFLYLMSDYRCCVTQTGFLSSSNRCCEYLMSSQCKPESRLQYFV